MSTDKLRLKLPGDNDDWGEVLKENFEKIDEEFAKLYEELAGSGVADIAGQLKGSVDSLKERLDALIDDDGTNQDIANAAASRIQSTTSINERLGVVDSKLVEAGVGDDIFSSAPDEVKRSRDYRSIARIDTEFYSDGSGDRFVQESAGDVASLISAGPGLISIHINANIWCLLGQRWCLIDDDKASLTDQLEFDTSLTTDGTWVLTAQTWDGSGETNYVDQKNIVNITSGSIDITRGGSTFSMSIVDLKVDDIVDIAGEDGYHKISSVPRDVEVYGKFENDLTEVAAEVYRPSRPQYLTLYSYTEAEAAKELFELSLKPNLVILGTIEISGGGSILTWTNADIYQNLQKHIWIDGGTFGTLAGHAISTSQNFFTLVKNIIPVIVADDGEQIIPGDWMISTNVRTNDISIIRSDTGRMCIRPSDGSDLLEADVSNWGVIVEI